VLKVLLVLKALQALLVHKDQLVIQARKVSQVQLVLKERKVLLELMDQDMRLQLTLAVSLLRSVQLPLYNYQNAIHLVEYLIRETILPCKDIMARFY
jgi:hypothetical protein